MSRRVVWLLAIAALTVLPQTARATGTSAKAVGLDSLLRAKLAATSGGSTSVVKSAPTMTSKSSTQTLPTQTLPAKNETVEQLYIQPVVQPIQRTIQPVVQTVIQPVVTETVAPATYLKPITLTPIYTSYAGVDSGKLVSGNPYLNSGYGKSSTSYGYGHGDVYGGGKGGYSGGFKGGFGGGSSHVGNYARFCAYRGMPAHYGFHSGASRGFAFGRTAFGGKYGFGHAGKYGFGGGSSALPQFGFSGVGQSLQQVFNYSNSFSVNGVNYTVDVSVRLSASFAGPSASPCSVYSI